MIYEVKCWIDGPLVVAVDADDADAAVDAAITALVAQAAGVFGNADFEAVSRHE